MPPEIHHKKVRKGELFAYQSSKVMALKWKDKKGLKSTIQQPIFINDKPTNVKDYNLTTGRVDHVDQHMSIYLVIQKLRNITKRSFSIWLTTHFPKHMSYILIQMDVCQH